jgi:hypothetical protein
MLMTEGHFKDLCNQFILVKNEKWVPSGWIVRQIGNWIMAAHPSLPVIELKLPPSKESVGWLLGYPIDLSRKELLTVGRLNCPNGAWLEVEDWLYDFAGRYLGILFLGSKAPRVYPDSSSSLAAIYSPDLEIVCSTCSTIGKGRRDDDWAIELVEAAAAPGWYPFGLTPHRTLFRLQPNHYLDCGSWTALRCWPSTNDINVSIDSSNLIRTISETVATTISAANRHGAYICLTAGADTRMVLACAHDEIGNSTFFTGAKDLDLHIANILADRFGLNHIAVELISTTTAEQADRLRITGYCCDLGGIDHRPGYKELLQKGKIIMMGLGGEVGRAYYWKKNDAETDSISPLELVSRMHFPLTRELVNRAEKWLQAMNGYNAGQVLDLTYLENRLGCWGGPNRYFFDSLGFPEIYAFNHRSIYKSMLRLPYDFRADQGLIKGICRECWPELLSLPINEYTGLRKLFKWFRGTPQLAKRMYRKLKF